MHIFSQISSQPSFSWKLKARSYWSASDHTIKVSCKNTKRKSAKSHIQNYVLDVYNIFVLIILAEVNVLMHWCTNQGVYHFKTFDWTFIHQVTNYNKDNHKESYSIWDRIVLSKMTHCVNVSRFFFKGNIKKHFHYSVYTVCYKSFIIITLTLKFLTILTNLELHLFNILCHVIQLQ